MAVQELVKAGGNLNVSEIDVEVQSSFGNVLVYTIATHIREWVMRQIYVKVTVYPLRIDEQ